MGWFADLHIHSRYSRACSKDLTVPNLDVWASKKGIRLLGSGDFTHPYWLGELKRDLVPAPEVGLFIRVGADADHAARFVLSVEISSIYSQAGRTRRIHVLILLPDFRAAESFNEQLSKRGAKLSSDGRPIVGMSAKEVAELALAVHPDALIIPAHAWTPWFSVFGSNSGFDSLSECFGELTPKILAIETGLSSDPTMNWRVSALDSVALVSFSDAHSPAKLGRELTEFDGELSYAGLREAIHSGAPARASERAKSSTKLVRTIEFFPEEGKYHLDGHRNCDVRLTPAETKKLGGLCPVCHRSLTVGVLSRVEALADRPEGFRPDGAPDFISVVPLVELIADVLKQKVGTQAVELAYAQLLKAFGNEMAILLDVEPAKISAASQPTIGQAVEDMRRGNLKIEPGYDGVFGTVHTAAAERPADTQAALF
jgi:uncharacterized protein (TIGR00375 family)